MGDLPSAFLALWFESEASHSHFCRGVFRSSHPGTILESLAELLIDLDSRVRGGT